MPNNDSGADSPNIAPPTVVPDPSARERLDQRLERLAYVATEDTRANSETQSAETESSSNSDLIRRQAEIIAADYAAASDGLGADANEDSIWKRIFEIQSQRLSEADGEPEYADRYPHNPEATEEAATSILVSNLLATYGMDAGQAASLLTERMWSLATWRMGQAVLDAAERNQGLCVKHADGAKPLQSIIEQTRPIRNVLAFGDRYTGQLSSSDAVLPELATASTDRQARVIGLAVMMNNTAFAEHNLANFSDEHVRTLAEKIAKDTYLGGAIRRVPRIGELVSNQDVIRWAIEFGHDPLNGIDGVDLAGSSREEQERLLQAVLDAPLPEPREDAAPPPAWAPQGDIRLRSIAGALTHSNTFTNLGPVAFERLVAAGLFEQHPHVSLRAFHGLPTGALMQVLTTVDRYHLAESAACFSEADQKTFCDLLLQGDEVHYVLRNPDQFTFTTYDQLLDVARDRGRLYEVAQAINKYTDGSNQQLIVEILNSNEYSGVILAGRINDMPLLDRQWFLQELQSRNLLDAVAECVGTVEGIDELALLDAILQQPTRHRNSALDSRLDHFNHANEAVILEKLFAAGAYETIARNVDFFQSESAGNIIERLKETDEGLKALATVYYRFEKTIEPDTFVHLLAERQLAESIAENAARFMEAGVDRAWLFDQVKGNSSALRRLLNQSSYAKPGARFEPDEIAAALFELPDGVSVLTGSQLKQLSPELRWRYIDACIERRLYKELNSHLDDLDLPLLSMVQHCFAAGFEEPFIHEWTPAGILGKLAADEIPMVAQLLEWGGAATILYHSDQYQNLPQEMIDRAYRTLLDRSNDYLLALAVQRTRYQAPDEVAARLLVSANPHVIGSRVELFDPRVFTEDFLVTYLDTDATGFIRIYNASGRELKWVQRAISAFSQDCPPVLMLASRAVLDENSLFVPWYLQHVGIRAKGDAGMDELRNYYTALRSALIYDADPGALAQQMIGNPMTQRIVMHLIRYHDAQWGDHNMYSFVATINAHLNSRPQHAPMPSEFVPSEVYNIRMLDAAAFDPSRLRIDVRERFDALHSDIERALEISYSPSLRLNLFRDAQTVLETEIRDLEARRAAAEQDNDTRRAEYISRRITVLQSYLDISPKRTMAALRGQFHELTRLDLPALNSLLRVGVFAHAIKASPEARRLALELHGTVPSVEAIGRMIDFVDHTVNEQVYARYFNTGTGADKNAYRTFLHLSTTKALQEQLAQLSTGSTSGTSRLQFVPTRGLPLEWSGHIGDACWASKYNSIAAEFPNISAIIMVRNPGEASQRLVGSCLLIDTVDQATGRPVLVVRGANPIQNFINTVRVDDFTDALLEYVRSIANGRDVAIVLDGHVGGATSNRPALYTHLTTTVRQQQTAGGPLELPPDTTFNGYVLQAGRSPAYMLMSEPK